MERLKALNAELLASMQAITCAAFAIDALNASILKVLPTPSATKMAWRKNRTKRSRQIFETLRRAFKMGPQSRTKIKTLLDQLSDARDTAVHPPARSQRAQRHARLPVDVDPAFNMFRARYAIVAVGAAVELIESAAKAETAQHQGVSERMAALLELVHPIGSHWRRSKAGKLFKELQRRAEASDE